MANLRIDDQRRVAPGQAPGQFDAPDASRGAEFASRQMQQTGQALSQAGQAVGAIYRAEVEKLNETRVNDAVNRVAVTAQEQQAEWSGLRGEAAIAVGENREPLDQVYGARFEKSVGDIAREMGLTGEQQALLAPRVATFATRYQGSMLEHVARERESYSQQVYTGGVAEAQEEVRRNPGDRELVRFNTQRIADLTDAESRRLGLPAAAALIASRTNVGKALADVVKDLADEDVDAAQAFFEANYEDMTAEQRDSSRTVLRPAIEARTAEQVADMFGPRLGGTVAAPGGASSFDQSMVSIWQSEGTALVADDNGAGRARFGITERSHPAAWADGEVTREEANAIYKRDYWDAIGADDLPAGMAHMAFDTAVNMGAGRARQLLDQAGGDVTKFAQLRRDEYRRIAAEDADGSSRQYLAGWLERTDRVEMEARGQAPAGPDRAPTMSVSQAVAAARAALPPGAPPSLVRATEAEVRRRYTEFDQAEAQGFETAQAEAYKYIDDNRAMPPASVLSRLKPGALQTVRNYLETTLRPAAVNSDPEFENFLIANPDQWEGMTRQEFAVFANGRLNPRDLANYQRDLYREETSANTAARALLADLGTVNATDFAAGWRESMTLMGQTPAKAGTEQARDQVNLQQSLRTWVEAEQRSRGRVLTPTEISDEIRNRMLGLQWNASMFQGGGRRVATSFSEMPQDRVDYYRRVIPRRGGSRNPSEEDIYRAYIADTLGN
jgi:hypothetical protein